MVLVLPFLPLPRLGPCSSKNGNLSLTMGKDLLSDEMPMGFDDGMRYGITYELIFVFHSFHSFACFLSLHPLLIQSISVSGLLHSPTCDEYFILTMCFVHYEFGSSKSLIFFASHFPEIHF
jgi:hypothetical protein